MVLVSLVFECDFLIESALGLGIGRDMGSDGVAVVFKVESAGELDLEGESADGEGVGVGLPRHL